MHPVTFSCEAAEIPPRVPAAARPASTTASELNARIERLEEDIRVLRQASETFGELAERLRLQLLTERARADRLAVALEEALASLRKG